MCGDELCVVLDAVKSFRSVVGELFADYTLNEILALLSIGEAEKQSRKLTMSDLASALKISKPAATQLVDRLEKRGCAERYTEGGDRRAVYLKSGYKLKNYDSETNRTLAQKYFAMMGEDDVNELKRILDKSAKIMAVLKQEKEQGVKSNA